MSFFDGSSKVGETAVEESTSEGATSGGEEVDSGIDDIVAFINLRKSENAKCRGPMLALIELHSRLVARRQPTSSDGKNIRTLPFDGFEQTTSGSRALSMPKIFTVSA